MLRGMTGKSPPSNTLALVVVATIAALVIRAMIRVQLRNQGLADPLAADIAYLLVPLVILVLTFPVWRSLRAYASTLYRRSDLTMHVVMQAVAIGLLMRVAWWAVTVSRVAFGWLTESVESYGPTFSWQCPAPAFFVLGIVVMAILVPLIEEIVHRGFVFRATLRWGAPTALFFSSAVFALFHESFSWPVVFVAGLIFTTQFHLTGSLWSSTLSHATYNLLVQFDWRCLRGRWQVAERDLPLLDIGFVATGVFLAALAGIIFLLRQLPETPRRLGH